jgi:hypothetical protein
MGASGECSLLFCAAKRSGPFPSGMPAGLRARVARLGGFTRPFSGSPTHYTGDPAETTAGLNVKLWTSVTGDW